MILFILIKIGLVWFGLVWYLMVDLLPLREVGIDSIESYNDVDILESHTGANTRIITHTDMHRHTQIFIHTYTHTHTHTNIYAHTYTHTDITDTRTYATQTDTRTYSYKHESKQIHKDIIIYALIFKLFITCPLHLPYHHNCKERGCNKLRREERYKHFMIPKANGIIKPYTMMIHTCDDKTCLSTVLTPCKISKKELIFFYKVR